MSIVVFAIGVHRALPRAPASAVFSAEALLGVWRFASGMMGITLLAILLTQVDKILLSRLLSLEMFGYYTLAATIAGVLYLVITPVTTALFPRLVELVSRSDSGALVSVYHGGAQLVTMLTAPTALLLAFFAEGVLFAWSGDAGLALHAGPILSALALGTFLNGLMYMPYQLQLAHGWTTLALRVNTAAVLMLVPAVFWIVPRHGALGAAWVWIVLNAGYIVVGVHLMHHRIVPAEKWRWYFHDVGLPILGAGASLLLMYDFKPSSLNDRVAWLEFLTAGFIAALMASAVTVRDLRARIFVSIRRVTST